MSTPSSTLPAQTEIPSSAPIPPAIQMVCAFEEAVKASRVEQDPAMELWEIENLIIAGEASFTALSRFANFWHDANHESLNRGDERMVMAGYECWIKATDQIRVRLTPLLEASYQSESVARLEASRQQARNFLDNAAWRRRLETQALRSDPLAVLARKLKPLHEYYDGEES